MTDVEISSFISKFNVRNPKCSTHTSMIKPTGNFQLEYEQQEQFMELYCNKLVKQKKFVHGIAEVVHPPNNFIPIIVDIDIKIQVSEQTPIERLYSNTNVEDLISIYQDTIGEIYSNITTEDKICYLLEKPPRKEEKTEPLLLNLVFIYFSPFLLRKKALPKF